MRYTVTGRILKYLKKHTAPRGTVRLIYSASFVIFLTQLKLLTLKYATMHLMT